MAALRYVNFFDVQLRIDNSLDPSIIEHIHGAALSVGCEGLSGFAYFTLNFRAALIWDIQGGICTSNKKLFLEVARF